jgi:transcriptional regulator with XRE-family HTH domain
MAHKTRIYLKEWRDVRGLTQARLAKCLRVNPMTVWRWERAAALGTRRMEQVAKVLRIRVIDLFRPPPRRGAK